MIAALAANDEQARALAREILARSRYAQWRPHGRYDWLQSFLAWLQDLLDRLNDLAVTRPVLYAFVLGTLLLVSLLLLVHVVYSLRLALAATPSQPPGAPPAPSFAERAASLARAGHFLDAAHQMELAVLDLLMQRRVVVLARSEPNRTLRRRLHEAALPEGERQSLIGLLDQLERQWFRDRAEDQTLYEAWCALHQRLRHLPEPA